MKLIYTGPPEYKVSPPTRPAFPRKSGVDYSLFSDTVWAEAHQVLVGGYYSISNNHKMVARLPVGRQTATDAVLLLKEAAHRAGMHDPESWVDGMHINSIVNHYLRCHAPPEDRRTLHWNVYNAFRKLGGTSAHGFTCPEGRIHVPSDVVQAIRDVEDKVEAEAFAMFEGKLGVQATYYLIGFEKLRKRLGMLNRRLDKAAIAKKEELER